MSAGIIADMGAFKSSRWALRRGQKLARAGRLDESLAAFDSASGRGDPRVLVQHGLALLRADRADDAVERIAQAAAAAPDDPVPAVFRAYALLRAGRLDEAAAEIDRARKLSPENPLADSLSGALEVLRGRLADGSRRLLAGRRTDNLEILGWILTVVEQKILELAGTDSGAIPPEPEKRREDEPPQTVPELRPDAAARRGERLLERGKPKHALPYLRRAVEAKPDDGDRRAMFGAALFEAGEFAQADAELALVPEKSMLTGVAQFYRAGAAYRLGRYDEAIRLIDTLPRTGEVFHYQEWCDYIRGMALVALGRTTEAARYLAAFIGAEPSLVERRLKKAIELAGKDGQCSTSS